MKKTIIISLIFIFFATLVTEAQRGSTRWKRMRYEVVYGLGGSNFLGELGGANMIGTDFIRDLEISLTRPMGMIGMRYKILENLATKASLHYGYVKGDDAKTEQIHRENRNLHFRSSIIEFSAQLEYSIVRERVGHRYNLRRVRGIKGFKTNTYAFVGVGAFYFNPKAKLGDEWFSLRPMGTEGQGLIPTRKMYSRVQVCIPFGIGFKYGLNRLWSIGLEYGIRKTFTDYIDDVSSSYYDNAAIRAANGDIAGYFADPSSGPPSWTMGGQQRGDSTDKDTYMFAVINLTYKLRTDRNGLPKFR
ncbi:MAG: hypothetical protein JXR58_08860 [Bacteroidales bacterium]|nr:hypothetical protein [Bacteroidales bacterium]